MADLRGLVRNFTYSEQAREVLRELIFNGTYRPGQRLKEMEISRDLGTSRAPIREAIQALANEGLVRLVPHKGAIVATFDAEEVRELYEVREALEIMAARLAAERAGPPQLDELAKMLETTASRIEENESAPYPRELDFHKQIFRLANNSRLEEAASGARAQLWLARSRSGSRPGRARESYQEHAAVFEALREKDPDKAERATRDHIRSGLKNMLDMLTDDAPRPRSQ